MWCSILIFHIIVKTTNIVCCCDPGPKCFLPWTITLLRQKVIRPPHAQTPHPKRQLLRPSTIIRASRHIPTCAQSPLLTSPDGLRHSLQRQKSPPLNTTQIPFLSNYQTVFPIIRLDHTVGKRHKKQHQNNCNFDTFMLFCLSLKVLQV